MLLLTNEDIEKTLSVHECVLALESAYRDFGEGDAVDIPRQDMLVSNSREGAVHALKTMSACWPRLGIAAVRLSSDVVTWPIKNGAPRRVKVPLSEPGNRYNGSLLLFSIETGQLLCMMCDGVVQKTRVGATCAVAAKYLARKDSKVLCLLGSGWQAEGHIEAFCAIWPFKEVRIFSPNEANRTAFAERFAEKLKLDIKPARSPDDAANGADIIISTTNSMAPTIRPEWVRPGVHIAGVRASEIPSEVLSKIDRLVVHTIDSVRAYPARGFATQVPEFTNGDYSQPEVDPGTVPELKDVIAGKAPARQTAAEISCFHNYKGLGLQFAVAGALAYRKALELKLGYSVEDDFFTQTVHP